MQGWQKCSTDEEERYQLLIAYSYFVFLVIQKVYTKV